MPLCDTEPKGVINAGRTPSGTYFIQLHSRNDESPGFLQEASGRLGRSLAIEKKAVVLDVEQYRNPLCASTYSACPQKVNSGK